ncbi:MAG: integrase, partial [Alteromonadaceae bacterium]|nr:integrase [Alteromonadaceae bacterium]
MKLQKRNNTYHLRKRVPARYQPVEERKSFYVSLGTDSLTLAQQKAAAIWNEQLEYWEARMAGDSEEAERRHAAAQAVAQMRGFRYLHAAQVAKQPREDVLERVEAIPVKEGVPDTPVAAAVLGAVSEPPITVSRALELYWDLAKDKTLGKSGDQLRRWKNPRRKAIRNFLEVVGDKPLAEITGDDTLNFRDFWYDRIHAEGLTANSANKDLTHLGDVLKTVNRMKRLNLVLPLSDLAFKEGE